MNKKQKELCERFYDETGIDLEYTIENNREDYDNIDNLMDYLQERVYEIECIGYYNAIKYLQEHDMSLRESLGLAHEMGYSLEDLSSEILATLLQQQEASEALHTFRDELEDVFFSE